MTSSAQVDARVASGPPRPVGDVRPGSAGHVLDLIRRTGGLTRAEILERTGLARSTVTTRLATLQSAGLVAQGGTTTAARGRPPSHFHFRDDNGALLLADAGATKVRTAVTDLDGMIRHEIDIPMDITIGPEAWLTELQHTLEQLMRLADCTPGFVRGIGLALPGPIDFGSATVVRPPIMVGWDGYPIREWFARTFHCPVIVDNDANVMTLGEYRAQDAHWSSMVMLKIATGIGAGIIAGSAIYRGEDGAAGDIGHIQITPAQVVAVQAGGATTPMTVDQDSPPRCRCGNLGCVEAYAGGWALVRDLRERGRDVTTVADLVDLLKSGDPEVLAMTRQAGRTIGIALADAVSLLNPGAVMIGGELGAAADNLVAGVREVIYARCLPLATRRLEIVPTKLGNHAGLTGLATILTDHIFDPARIDAQLG